MTYRNWSSAVIALLLALDPSASRATPATPHTRERAADRSRVAVVGLADAELTTRLVAELRFLGLAPEVLRSPAASEAAALSEVARRAGVEAVIRIDPSAGRIEIWIADRTTGTLVVRELATSIGSEVPRDLAVRTAELFRALHAGMGRAPPPRAPTGPNDAMAPHPAPRPPPRFSLGAGVGVGGAPGGVPAAAYARAQLRHMPHPNVGMVLTGMATLHPTAVTGQAARLRSGGIAVGPRFVLRPPNAILVPDLSVAIGATFIDVRPVAAGQGTRTHAVDARVEGAAGLEVRLSRRLRLRSEIAVGACTQTIRLRVAGHPVAAWCSPHALGTLGLGLVL